MQIPGGEGLGISCLGIGSLDEFVQHLDEGPEARSLHFLMGQLHMATADEQAKRQWVAAVRDRFAATLAACFEFDSSSFDGGSAIVDPAGGTSHALAMRALKSALQNVGVGEAVACTTASITGVAVRCGPSRVVGMVLERPKDTVSNPRALLQYLAAIVWHVKCADIVAGKMRMLARRPTPLDLIEMLPLPCVITDGAGRAVERNDTFSEFMDAAALRIATGRLRFDDPYLQDSWQLALSEVDVTAVRQTLLVTAPDGRQWQVHLVPLRFVLEVEHAAERQMILAIVERQAASSGVPLEQMIGESARPLTPAEQEVLDSVLQGHSAKVIATARGASVNTVRSQITAILEKTGHHNQKSLMAAFAPSGFRSSTFASSFNTPPPVRQAQQVRRIPVKR
jgi:DNA-binding CsgD family transcriptional regulator